MENSFSSVIESANSILILLPKKPYLDQVAAGLSLFLSLKRNKEINISCSSEMVVEFNRLVGVDKITTELGNKNLTVRFSDYDAANIERVSYDIENGRFKLTVIPKPGCNSPKKDQLEIFQSGVSAELIILIGGGSVSHFPSLNSKDFSNSKVLHLGIKDIGFREIISFVRPASSVSEIVAGFIKDGNYYLDPDIATNLIAGIEDESNQFNGSDVTAETFQTVADLMRAGGTKLFQEKNLPEENFPPGSIPSKPYQETPVFEEEKKTDQNAPQDWLGPKIYKGNSLS